MNVPFQTTRTSLETEAGVIHPKQSEEQQATSSPSLLPAQDGPPQTILLVDDEEDLRYVMGLTLSMHGYRVVPCSTAELASSSFRKTSSIDLLLTDMQMPGKSGIELARELTALQTSLPVLIVSGGIPTPGARSEMRDRGWKFLTKTDDENTFLGTVAALLRK